MYNKEHNKQIFGENIKCINKYKYKV